MKSLAQIVVTAFFITGANHTLAENSRYFSLGTAQTKTDFFGDDNSPISPDSRSASFSQIIGERWLIELAYEKISGTGRWLKPDTVARDRYDRAETDSNTIGFGVLWQGDDFGLSLGYSRINSSERSLTFLPVIVESVNSHDNVVSFSWDNTYDFSEDVVDTNWTLDWSLGLQYVQFEIDILDQFNVDPPTEVNSNINQTSLSAYFESEVAYEFQQSSFSWGPFFSLGWNWGMSENGEQVTLLSRNGEQIMLDDPNGRFSANFKTPDSGQWSTGVMITWDSGWSTSLNYGQNVATDFDLERLSLDVSVAF